MILGQESENEKTKSLIVYRLDQLEHKQDKYNHLSLVCL